MANKADFSQDDTKAASALAIELKKAKERQVQLEYALKKVFPIEKYKQARPEVEAQCEGIREKIIEHFIEYDVNEIDFQKEGEKIKLGLYENLKEAATLLASELQRSKERERENFKYADIAALKATKSCLKNLNLKQNSPQSTGEGKRSLSLLKTKGDASNLKTNQDHDFAIKHTSIHYQSNSICTWIPKNGCSNLRYAIAKGNGTITSLREIEWIHLNNDCFNASTKEALQADYAYIILRNPFKRLLSFFLDKLCHSQDEHSEESYQRAHKAFNFNKSLSFTDFIDHIWENIDSIYNDEHTRPQCDFLLYRSYDQYFSLEKIKLANQEIYARTGINVEDIRDKNSIFTSKGCERTNEITHTTKAIEINNQLNKNKIPIAENMYTNEMIKKVSTLYLQDILLYCSEVDNGIDELDYWIQRAIANE